MILNEYINMEKLFTSTFFYSYLLLPTINNTRKRSPIHDKVPDEKRRRLNDDDILSPPKSVDELKPIGKQVLEILNTPLVEKSISSPSIANCSSILKVHLNNLICILFFLCLFYYYRVIYK